MTSLFTPSAPKTPTIIQPAAAPVPNQGAIADAQKQQLQQRISASGRQSTILTEKSDKFGGS